MIYKTSILVGALFFYSSLLFAHEIEALDQKTVTCQMVGQNSVSDFDLILTKSKKDSYSATKFISQKKDILGDYSEKNILLKDAVEVTIMNEQISITHLGNIPAIAAVANAKTGVALTIAGEPPATTRFYLFCKLL